MNHQGSTFLSGCAPFTDLVFFAKENDDLADRGKPNSSFFFFDQGDWIKYDKVVNWPALSLETIGSGDDRVLVAIGPDGDYWELENRNLKESTGRVCAGDINLRSLAVVEDAIHAIGMDRTVLRRDGLNHWTSFGPRPATEAEGIVGFEDLDAYSKNELYAVGWQGEIWLFDGKQWRQIDSPVSANLNAVCCGADNVTYIVGDHGTMLRGRGGAWEVLDTGCDEDLMDVCQFGNEVFVVTDFKILILREDELIEETRFFDDRPTTCLHLLRADDGIVATGPKDLFCFVRGQWKRLA